MVQKNIKGDQMGEDLKKVLAYLKELGFTPDVDNFQDKLIIQKTVCLLKLLGVKLHYPFSLYVRGPYSPSLTKDLYANKKIVNNLKTDYVPTKKEKKQLQSLYSLSNELNPTLLEIMSTYAFLIYNLKKDDKQAIIDLKKIKCFYSEGRIAVGISRTKELLFKPSKKDIDKMKAEFRNIEEASLSDMERF